MCFVKTWDLIWATYSITKLDYQLTYQDWYRDSQEDWLRINIPLNIAFELVGLLHVELKPCSELLE